MPGFAFTYVTASGEVVHSTAPMTAEELQDWDAFIAQAPSEPQPELWELI